MTLIGETSASAAADLIKDGTDQGFMADVIETSKTTPVIVDFEYGPHGLSLVGLEQMRRPSARVATALVVDLVTRGITDEVHAVEATRPEHVLELLHPQPKLTGTEITLVTGLGASPGAAVGAVALSSEEAVSMAESGAAVILAMAETTPGDLPGMMAAEGILTINGGSASHAAVVARGMGRPAICGASNLRIVDGALVSGDVTVPAGASV